MRVIESDISEDETNENVKDENKIIVSAANSFALSFSSIPI